MRRKILISVGFKKREFEYQCLFAYFLEQAGFDVKIRYANFEFYKTIFLWQPDIVIVGQVNQQENINVAKYAKACGACVVVINSEGTYDDRGEVYRFRKYTNDFVDVLIAWGKKHKEDALRFSDIDAKKVVVTGTPKLDMYNSTLAPLVLAEKPYQNQLDPKKKTICVSTAFASADVTWDMVKGNLVYQKLGRELVEIRHKGQRTSRDQFIKLALLLAKKNRYNVIFRIHPLEQPDYYLQHLASQKNIIFDNDIIPARLFTVTDLLVHRTSTLGTEAWITDIPTLCFDPLYDQDHDMMPFTSYEELFHTIPEILAFLQQNPSLKYVDKYRKEKKEYLQYWFNYSKDDAQLASKKIATIFKKMTFKQKHHVWHPNGAISLGLAFAAHLLGKKYAYEVIAMKKGEEYRKIVQKNYIEDKEVRQQIHKYSKQLLQL